MPGGGLGYGLGMALKMYMDRKFRSEQLAKEQERIDLEKRRTEASEAERGLLLDDGSDGQGLTTQPQNQAPVSNPSVKGAATASPQKTQAQPSKTPALAAYSRIPVAGAGFLTSGEDELRGPKPDLSKMSVEPGAAPDQAMAQSMPEAPAGASVSPPQSDVPRGTPGQGRGFLVPEKMGRYRLAPWKRAELEAKTRQNQFAVDWQDPNSDLSRRTVQSFRDILNEGSTGRGDQLLKGDLSAFEAAQIIPTIEKFDTISANKMRSILAGLKDNAMINRWGVQDDLARKRLGITEEHYRRMGDIAGKKIAQSEDRMDRMTHNRVLQRLASDQVTKQRLTQYQNLDNALNSLLKAKNITPQSLHEFQQTIRSNLGIKGTSGVIERGNTYMNGLGLKIDEWNQFLSEIPADVDKNHPFVKHFKDLARREQSNIRSQIMDRLDALSEGNGSMYDRRPDLKRDLFRAKAAYTKMVPPVSQEAANDPTIEKYAKQYGLRYDQAETLLRQRGYNGQR